MIKRLSNDTSTLKIDFEELGTKYNTTLSENQELAKKLREKEKLCTFLEKEVERRGQEFKDMTATFEEFLSGRAKQARRDRNEKLLKVAAEHEKLKSIAATEVVLPQFGSGQAIVKSVVPDRGFQSKEATVLNANVLDRGYVYLKRFKNLSRAFASGDFRPLANVEQQVDNAAGPWQKTPLYSKLEDTSLSVARLYHENTNAHAPSRLAPKPQVYGNLASNAIPGAKVYKEKLKTAAESPAETVKSL
ncbi:hypothetical protein HDV03_001519 [Kappamyces sp. JEL0829]|nr:hypothetical protein HDV03_001519 [Kappamyces sp. JEL0829]